MDYGYIKSTDFGLSVLDDNDLARVVLTGLHAIDLDRDELAEAVRMVRDGDYYMDGEALRLDASFGEYLFAEDSTTNELAQEMAESFAEEQADTFYQEIGALVPDMCYVTFETEKLARDIILGGGASILASYDGRVEEFTMRAVDAAGIVGPAQWFNVWRTN